MSIAFSGINIHAKDPVKTYEFYKELGFTEKSEANPGDEWYGAEFDLGGESVLWIWRDNSGDVETGGSGADDDAVRRMTIQIVIKCDDIDATYNELRSKGYDISEPTLMFYGGKEMNLTDPEGNKILFLD